MNMSFALTVPQMEDGSKTETRRRTRTLTDGELHRLATTVSTRLQWAELFGEDTQTLKLIQLLIGTERARRLPLQARHGGSIGESR